MAPRANENTLARGARVMGAAGEVGVSAHLLPKLIKFFLVTAGVTLIVTGIAKLYSTTGSSRILLTPDPVFWISTRKMLIIVSLTEIVCAWLLLSSGPLSLKLGVAAWLATSFLVYRTALALNGAIRCPCLGTLAGTIGIPDWLADSLMIGVLFYLLVGSYGLLLWLRHIRKQPL
jgi:hypothetical protein